MHGKEKKYQASCSLLPTAPLTQKARSKTKIILQIFIRIHAEENKRRTLQRSDIAAAIVKTDMFDFLIDIVPREEYKMSVTKEPKASNYHHPTAEQRRSQDMFMPPPTGAEPNLAASALEGYGYPYILENEAFSMVMDLFFSSRDVLGLALSFSYFWCSFRLVS